MGWVDGQGARDEDSFELGFLLSLVERLLEFPGRCPATCP